MWGGGGQKLERGEGERVRWRRDEGGGRGGGGREEGSGRGGIKLQTSGSPSGSI